MVETKEEKKVNYDSDPLGGLYHMLLTGEPALGYMAHEPVAMVRDRYSHQDGRRAESGPSSRSKYSEADGFILITNDMVYLVEVFETPKQRMFRDRRVCYTHSRATHMCDDVRCVCVW